MAAVESDSWSRSPGLRTRPIQYVLTGTTIVNCVIMILLLRLDCTLGFTVTDITRMTWMNPGIRFDSNGVLLKSDSFIDTSAVISANAVCHVVYSWAAYNL